MGPGSSPDVASNDAPFDDAGTGNDAPVDDAGTGNDAQVDDEEEGFSCADFVSPVPGESRSQIEIPPPDLRNYRYCEVVPAFAYGDGFCVEVYNTLSFNDCPEADWSALDEDTLRADLGAAAVFLNGPRHWVINGASGNSDPMSLKIASFGNLQMARPGLLELESLTELPSTSVR